MGGLLRWITGVAISIVGFALAASAELPSSLEAPLPSATPAHVIPIAAWQDPPREARPVARWWWPGGSVDPDTLRSHLQQIRDAGFGAVELQPLLLSMGEKDIAADSRLRTVGTPAFVQSVALATAAAAEVGLDFDFTLSSGWPGGLPTAKLNAERQLLMAELNVTGPVRFDAELPPAPGQSYRRAVEWVLDVLGPPDPDVQLVAVLAGRLGKRRDGVPILKDVRTLTGSTRGTRLVWDVPEGEWRIFAFYENSTGHFVMGGAFPGDEADALVVDHLSQRGADALLNDYAAPVLDATKPGQVREVFVDSFELMGELPFTGDFLAAFQSHTGYDLTPHLPIVFRKGGESKYGEMIDFLGRGGGPLYVSPDEAQAERIREDYEAVRAKLFEEKFVARLIAWAHARGLLLRLQAHGGYVDYLDLYAMSDVPASEALFGGGSFDFLKLAASAAHVADRRWVSSESFITLRMFGTRLSQKEMRLLAGRAYSAGINRLAFHGVPYPYTRANGKTWFPFSGGFGRILAGPLPMSSKIDADFLQELPEFNRFLSRLSVAMSAGTPVADVAWLRSDPIYPDTASLQLGRIKARAGESEETRALRARGLVHDRVSRRMLAGARTSARGFSVGARQYRALLLDTLEIAQPELIESIAALAEAGVPVLALGKLPYRAPGLRDAEARDARVRASSERLSKLVVRVPSADRLEALLAQTVTGSLVEPPADSFLEVSLERRSSDAGETLLVFNESWSSHQARLRFVKEGGQLTRWNPWDGSWDVLRERIEAGTIISLDLTAAESLILTVARPGKPSRHR